MHYAVTHKTFSTNTHIDNMVDCVCRPSTTMTDCKEENHHLDIYLILTTTLAKGRTWSSPTTSS